MGAQEHSIRAFIAPSEEKETGSLVVMAWAAKRQFRCIILADFISSSNVLPGLCDV